MAPAPRYIVRRHDGQPAGELFDLPGQRLVSLHMEDLDLARLLQERGVVSPRPPYLDAAHGGYVPQPQLNWFLEPPVENVAAALDEALRAAGYEIVPVAGTPAAGSPATTRA